MPKPKGFTLIEALVSLTLLTVGLVPAFYTASQASSLSLAVRNSRTATALAQEGVEAVRALRDANWFSGAGFATGLSSCSPVAGGCLVAWDSTSLLPAAGNPPLSYDPTTGLYQYATGDASPFARLITIRSVSAHELEVVSEVSWTERNKAKSVVVEYHLYDWLQ